MFVFSNIEYIEIIIDSSREEEIIYSRNLRLDKICEIKQLFVAIKM